MGMKDVLAAGRTDIPDRETVRLKFNQILLGFV
jgi:hypothetical protein